MLKELANAVVAELNGRTWSLSFQAVRRTRVRQNLAELANLAVWVAPGKYSNEAVTRETLEKETTIGIVVQQRVGAGAGQEDTTETEQLRIDLLTTLCEEIVDHFAPPLRFDDLVPSLADCVLVKTTHEMLASAEYLDQARIFVGVITLTFLARN